MESLRLPDAHSIHESGRIIRRASTMKNRWRRQIIIAESVVSQSVAGWSRTCAGRSGACRAGP
ncbi:hypothetical protein C6T58_25625 [Burkholderia multivorans]|nr:hypothetical protein C6Q11_25855 [Burkholderia multivorans]PRG75617.1 hypothetical protein C6T58_25625 [Burkholderia multivorans]